MTDKERNTTNDAIDEQGEEASELTGQPLDRKSTPRIAGQSDIDADKAKSGDSKQAGQEQDRQLESGEESPS